MNDFSKWLKDAGSLGIRIVEVWLPPGKARALDDFVIFNKLSCGFLYPLNMLYSGKRLIFIFQGENLEKFIAFLKENGIGHDDWGIKSMGMSNDLKIMLEFISKMEPGKEYGIYNMAALLPDDLVDDFEKIIESIYPIINLSTEIGILELNLVTGRYLLSGKAQELKVKLKNQHDNEVVHEIEKRHKAWMNATESLADIIRRKNANQEDPT